MGPRYSFVIFISIILLLSFAINFYVLSRLCGLFRIKKKLVFWAVVIVCTVSFIGARILWSFVDNIVVRIIYVVSVNWYGILWLLFSTLVVYEISRLFIKIKSSVAGASIIIIVSLATIYSMVNAQLLHIKRLEIPGNANLNIIQLSDIHLGSVSANFLKRIIEKTNALEPDLVLITGDLVDGRNKRILDAVGLLKNLKAPVFFVTGNHEGYAGRAEITKVLTDANVRVLNNQLINYGLIQIIGIDIGIDKEDIKALLGGLNIDRSKFCILMCHRPVALEILTEAAVNLALSGHTHAGQIFPFNYIVGLFYQPLYGLHRQAGSYLYVTSGTGTWGPRMRLGSRNEIVLLKIRKNFK